jgi:hypothetical protein
MGAGDYSTLYLTPQIEATINIQMQDDGTYTLESLGFGHVQMTGAEPEKAYYQSLGYNYKSGETQSALIATNFKGLGLPEYIFYQFLNLLK